jgi:hypothetical protein
VKVSSALIHFGMGVSLPAFGRLRHCRQASRSSSPRTSLMTLTVREGPLEVPTPAVLATIRTIVATAASPSIQPPRKAGPLLRAFGVISIRMMAMIGSGLMAMAIAEDLSPRPAYNASAVRHEATGRLPGRLRELCPPDTDAASCPVGTKG